jgi:hypothetical protein
MKKKVVIQGVPKSSKKKVVIQGLPKADVGMGMVKPNIADIRERAQSYTPVQKTSMLQPANQTNETDENTGSYYQGAPDVTEYGKRRMQSFLDQNPDLLETTDDYGNKIKTGDKDAFMQKVEGQVPFKTGIYEIDNTNKPTVNKKSKGTKPNVNWDFSKSNFGLFPLSGGKYAQRGFNYLNQIPGQVENAVSVFKTGKPTEKKQYPIYNPYVNAYWNYAEGGYLPEYGDAGMTGATAGATAGETTDDSQDVLGKDYSQLDEYLGGLDRSGRKDYLKGLKEIDPETRKEYGQYKALKTTQQIGAVAAPVASTVLAGYNFAKQGLSDVGSNIANRKAQQAENQLYTQSVFSDAMNVTPYEEQGYGFTGRNALAADGMQIKQIGGMGEPNVEVEGEEHIQLPNGFSQEIQGKKHSEGGIPINLPQGTKIFSEKLKVPVSFLKEAIALDPENQMLKSLKLPKTGKVSYADLAKKFETKKYVDLLNSKDADAIQMTTAQLMIQQNNAKLEQLFGLQEQNKISGVHGPQVQQNAQQEQQEQEAQQAQMQGEQMEQPMMKYGGYLPKAKTGGKDFTKWKGQLFKTPVGINTPQGVSLNVDPLANWASYAQRYAPIDDRITEQQTPQAILALQEAIYDDYLDTTEGKDALRKMWQTYGVTNKNESKYSNIASKIKKGERLTDEDLNTLRVNYMDTFAGKRLPEYIQPVKPTTAVTTTATTKEEETKPDAPVIPQTINNTYEVPGLNLGIALPNVYERMPLNYYKTEPEYIDPRYLDIQPQLNRIGRGQRAIESTLGSRGSSDMANLLQAQANRAASEQEAYGQKYNYDRAQDAAAQQFNAQAKMNANQYNQGTWFQQLEDPIRRRESLIGTQQMMDDQAAIENARKMQAFYGNKDFIGNTFYPGQNWTTDYALADLPILNKESYERGVEEGKKAKKKEKYGGKIKIKPKLKNSYF